MPSDPNVFASGGLNGPFGVVFGPDDNLYVNSYFGNSVLRFSGSTGAFIDTFVSPGSGGLTGPTSLIFRPSCTDGPGGGDLVGYWKAEGNACDSADGNHGTLVGTVGFAAGIQGQAFQLNSQSEYVEIPHDSSLNPANFTLTAWVNPVSLRVNYWDTILSSGTVGGGIDNPLSCCGDSYFLRFFNNKPLFGTAHPGDNSLLGPNNVTLNQWHHMAATFDGSTKNLYLDGTLVATTNISAAIVYEINPVSILIGEDLNNNNPVHIVMQGLIDEVKIYNTAHTTEEIQAQYCDDAINPLIDCATDDTPPVVTVPANITEEATSVAGAAVIFSASANDDVDGPIAATCDPLSASTFPIGDTLVDCTATDQAENEGSASFTVTVEDTTDSVVTAPDDVVEEATGPLGALVSYSGESATDAVGVVSLVCVPASGTQFAKGDTQVNCTAADAAGNEGSASFTVSVVDTTAPVVTADLVPVPGEVEDDEGLFTALFDCSDACDDNPVLTGVISTPSLAGLQVELKTKSKVKVVFDLDEGKVKIEGPNPAALLAELQLNGGLVIASGDQVHFEMEDDQDELTFKYDDNGVLKVEGNLAELVAKCEDSSGNIGSDSAVPVFSVDDDSSDDDSGDDDSGDDESGDDE